MNNNTAIIIGGTGQYGITLGHLLVKKKYKVIITTRYVSKTKKYKKKYPKLKFLKLNIYNKIKIRNFLEKFKPSILFYFAGQSSPLMSFKKRRETLNSNFIGCKNFLEIIYKNNIDVKFFNAASSEMYGKLNKKINLNSVKKPLNPYGLAKKKSFNLVKKYREKFEMPNYNLIMFNTESFLRNKNFLIAKICIGAIEASKKNKKLTLNNIIVSREWNWCEEQCSLILKFLKKAPQDFILSNGKAYTIKQMLKFAFGYFNLNYRNYVIVRFNKLKQNEVKIKKSDFKNLFKKNNIKFKSKIFGKKLIYKMIKYYLNGKKI